MTLDEARLSGLPVAVGATAGNNEEREENITPGPGEISQKAGDVRPAPVRPPAEVAAPVEPVEYGWQPQEGSTSDMPDVDPTDALVARIDRIIAKARGRDADRLNAKLDELEAALS